MPPRINVEDYLESVDGALDEIRDHCYWWGKLIIFRSKKKVVAVVLMGLALSSCSKTWSTNSVKLQTNQSDVQTAHLPKSPPVVKKLAEDVLVTEQDITDRNYRAIGDLDVSVNKTTIFHDDPTREMVDNKLQEEAAKIGADAVILVRYGTVGISLFSWGSLNGKGRAIAFTD